MQQNVILDSGVSLHLYIQLQNTNYSQHQNFGDFKRLTFLKLSKMQQFQWVLCVHLRM